METNKAKLDAAYSHLKSCCVVLLTMVSFTINAQTVSSKKAIEIAEKFYHKSMTQQSSLKSADKISFTLIETENSKISSQTILKSTKSVDAYHIINIGNKNGFIIIAGDERANPILGYTTNGEFNSKDVPDQLQALLDNYKNEVSLVLADDPEYKITPNSKWTELSSPKTKSAAVASNSYLITSEWDQGKYYNANCPEDVKAQAAYDKRAPAGCVAAAVSQIMRYWEWPETGAEKYCYTPPTTKSYGELCADFNTKYDWSQMPDKLLSKNSQEEKDAVAKIIYHTAVAVKTDFTYYGSSASSSTAKNAMKYYFDYSPKAKLVYKRKYTDEEWVNLLKSHIDNNVPLYYRGDDNGNFGHAFICDGYDSENRFHFNWGWGGSYDGFYSLNAIIPRTNYNFNYHQGALINLFPDNEDYVAEDAILEEPTISEGENIVLNYKQAYKGYDFNEAQISFGYYFSNDMSLDSEDILLSEENVGLSSKQNSIDKSIVFDVPENTSFGTYYLLVVADNKNEFEEKDEKNNITALKLIISEPVTADFLVENANAAFNKNATVGNTTIQTGERLLLTCRQKYDGNSSSAITLRSGYFLSTDKFLNSDDIVLAEGSSSLSSSKQFEDITLEVTIPDEVVSDKYYLLFVSDHENEFIEPNEDNNITSLEIEINNCADFMEPNNTQDFANNLGEINEYFMDNLCIHTEDEDWFTFTLASKTYYVKVSNGQEEQYGNYGLKINKYNGYFDIETFETTGKTDTKIWLYDENFELLTEDDNSGDDNFSFISHNLELFDKFSSIENQISVYPNPTNGEVFINTNLTEFSNDIQITVMDKRGAILQQGNMVQPTFYNQISVDLSEYPRGEYIIALYSNNGMKQAKRIVRQ